MTHGENNTYKTQKDPELLHDRKIQSSSQSITKQSYTEMKSVLSDNFERNALSDLCWIYTYIFSVYSMIGKG